MKIKTIIYFLFLIGATVLVSFKGGNISYILFYFALILPLVTLVYSFYVYCKFKIAQEVSRVVVKEQEIPYRLELVNEEIIPFINLSLNFFTEKVVMQKISADEETQSENNKSFNALCLPPHEKISISTKMYCKYRGTYSIGVKSVAVTDFFGLFTITYPLTSTIRITAKPRLLPLEKLNCSLKENDAKNNLFSLSALQNLPDCQLRKYYPGDSQKYIHWKNSAKAGELLVRKQMPEEQFETVIIIDLAPIQGDAEKCLQTEDNIIESALALANDYFLKKIPVRIIYMDNKLRETIISTRIEFDAFYSKCADLCFNSQQSVEKVWQTYLCNTMQKSTFILVTSNVTTALKCCAQQNSAIGNEIVIIDAGELKL